MPDYDNGKIYQLVFADRPERYIGSTTQELHQRLSGHRSTSASLKVKKLVDAVGRMNVRIILIEDNPCSNNYCGTPPWTYTTQQGKECVCSAGWQPTILYHGFANCAEIIYPKLR